MHFDGWDAGIDEGVVERITVVRERPGVDDDTSGVRGLLLQKIYERALVIGLERFTFETGLLCFGGDQRFDIRKRQWTVVLFVAFPQHVEVRPVYQKDRVHK